MGASGMLLLPPAAALVLLPCSTIILNGLRPLDGAILSKVKALKPGAGVLFVCERVLTRGTGSNPATASEALALRVRLLDIAMSSPLRGLGLGLGEGVFLGDPDRAPNELVLMLSPSPPAGALLTLLVV